MKTYKVDDIKPVLTTAKKVLIVVPALSVDGIASSLALALTLKKIGKSVSVFCPQTPDANYSKLAGLEMLTNTLSTDNLTISLNYPLDQIEKVSSNENEGRLNVVIETKSGAPQVENNQIVIQNNASGADLFILMGDPAALGDKQSLLTKGVWLQLTPSQSQTYKANYTIFDPDAPFSEVLPFLLPSLGINLDPDPAKNLLIALRVATQSFSVNVSPETFEAGAICLKASQLGQEPIAAAPQTPTAAPAPTVNPVSPNPVPTL